MSIRDRINNEYFEWMYHMMCDGRYTEDISYRKLFAFLHSTEFRYFISRDSNRAEDGIDLRYRFDHEVADLFSDEPCSVLEMMVALAIRCESLMDNPKIGDRTSQWFWGMIANLGLGPMTDRRFDRRFVDRTVKTFLNREYEPDGKGGLFTVRNCDRDLRDVEIWHQMCWYLDTIS